MAKQDMSELGFGKTADAETKSDKKTEQTTEK